MMVYEDDNVHYQCRCHSPAELVNRPRLKLVSS